MLTFHPFEGTLDDWGKALSTFPDAEIFQTPDWLRFIAESHRATPVVATLQEGTDVVGYFAGLTLRKFGIKILGSPFIGWTTDFMGIRLKDGVSKRAAIEALQHFAFQQLGCFHLEFADRRFGPDDVAGLGFEVQPSISYLLDLRPDEDAIYHGFSSKSCRYPIRKAAKEGVVIEEASDDAFAADYYAQLKEVFAKQGLVPTYGPDRVRLLIEHLFPTGNLLLLRARDAHGTCIATGIFLGANRTAYFWGNASWRQHQHLCPNEAMHWYAIRYWKRHGMEIYDFCGGRDYKRKYGGREVQRFLLCKSKYRWTAMARESAHRLFNLKQRMLGSWKSVGSQRQDAATKAALEGTGGIAETRTAARDETGGVARIHKGRFSGKDLTSAQLTRLRVVEYADEWNDALAAFNVRLAASGSNFRFPPPPDRDVATPVFHQGLKEVRYLALEEGSAEGTTVRGAYAMKFQEFWLSGDVIPVVDLRLPVSESIVDRSYSHVALALLFNAQKRQPVMYGLGMGGFHEPIARLLKAAGWRMFSVPFHFQVIHPFPFLRNIVHLRNSAAARVGCDLLAYSGLGWLSVAALKILHPRRVPESESVRAEVVEDFGSWADDVWEAGKSHYGFCSLRDAATLRRMYPCQVPNCARLKISAQGRPIGWSLVLNTALSDHAYFGNMRLGSIVDCFAEPQNAAYVLDQSREYLMQQGADLIVSNQSHRAWREAFQRCGFLTGPSNFLFASSRALTEAMERNRVSPDDVHVNRGDGDGPINL